MVTNVTARQVLKAQHAKSTSMNAPAHLARTTETALTRRMAINVTVSLPLRAQTARQVFLQASNISHRIDCTLYCIALHCVALHCVALHY